ncbi:MAG TPA: kelch repeat-containing protein [Candidatus Limnocylindrales bacterium]
MRECGASRGLRHLAPAALAIAALVGGCAGGVSPSPGPTSQPAGAVGVATPSSAPVPHAVFVAAGSMKTAHHNAVLLRDGTVLMVGGEGSTGRAVADTEIFDPKSGKYSAGPALLSPRLNPTVTVMADGRVLVAGGEDATTSVLATAEILDPAGGVFKATGSMAVPRTEATAFLLPTGNVLILGGKDPNGTVLSSAELYHPNTGEYTPTGSMLQPRHDYGTGRLKDGRILVVGGCCTWASLPFTSAEMYDPSSGSFQSSGSMVVGRRVPAVTVLADGLVLITGGNGSELTDEPLDSAETFDPETLAFKPIGSMTIPRDGAVGVEMRDQRVLMIGGTSDRSAEIFDPASGRFEATGPTIGSRSRSSTAILLPDGRIYVAGGGPGADATSAEMYQP